MAAPHNGWRAFRFLLVVYGLALSVAIWEFLHRNRPVDVRLDAEPNFTNVFFELYPDRGEANYERAMQMALCLQAATANSAAPPACRQFESADMRKSIRRLLEKAAASGIKTEEGVYYHTLQVLIGSGASPGKIDVAYRAWKANYPHSRLPDPRPGRNLR